MRAKLSPLVARLRELEATDRRAMAVLRRSLAFDPGTWPPAYVYVERFVGGENISPRYRNASYLTAGLFAMHTEHCDGISMGEALRRLAQKRPHSKSIEDRFLSLLAADDDLLLNRLRQALSLLRAEGIGLDYNRLLQDLTWWKTDNNRVQRNWARDYYRREQVTTAEQDA